MNNPASRSQLSGLSRIRLTYATLSKILFLELHVESWSCLKRVFHEPASAVPLKVEVRASAPVPGQDLLPDRPEAPASCWPRSGSYQRP